MLRAMALILLITATTLTGCGGEMSIKNNVEIGDVPPNKSVVMFYVDTKSIQLTRLTNIAANNKVIGRINIKCPLVYYFDPGEYRIHSNDKIFGKINRVSTFDLKKGQIHYIKMYLDQGLWVSSIRMIETDRPERI